MCEIVLEPVGFGSTGSGESLVAGGKSPQEGAEEELEPQGEAGDGGDLHHHAEMEKLEQRQNVDDGHLALVEEKNVELKPAVVRLEEEPKKKENFPAELEQEFLEEDIQELAVQLHLLVDWFRGWGCWVTGILGWCVASDVGQH